MKFFIIFLYLWAVNVWALSNDEVPIVLNHKPPVSGDVDATARVDTYVDYKTLKAISYTGDWNVGEILAVESHAEGIGIVAFLEVMAVEGKTDGTWELTCDLVRQSRTDFIQIGDRLIRLDLSTENPRYVGTTDLIVRTRNQFVSAKYKPLFTQGVSVGETAETLNESEYLLHWFGQLSYGWRENLTVGTVLLADVLGAPNANFKWRFHRSDSNVFATGLSYVKVPNETRSTLNLNFIWDSLSSESLISHTFFSLALFTFEEAEKATAIKSFGSSSFQTGYEFILDNWDRVLVGPTYYFESKAVGGYLSYLKIFDHFHMGLSVNSTNVASMKLSPEDGYYFAFDAYWRF